MSLETRRRVLDVLARTAGQSTAQIARAVGIHDSTAAYHLRQLHLRGLVRSGVVGRTRRWFPIDSGFCPVLRRAIPVAQRENANAVLRVLTERGASAAELSERTGIQVGAARWVAGQLVDAFIAERTRSGLLALRPGAERCVTHALAGSRCFEWGRCPISLAWTRTRAERVQATGPLTSSR